MALTYIQSIGEIRNHIHRNVSGYANSRVGIRYNWAQEWIAEQYTWRDMIKIDTTEHFVDGQKNYNFPTRIKEIYDIVLVDGSNSRKLVYKPKREFDILIPSPEALSETRPVYYTDIGYTFDVFPIPDAEYDMRRVYSQYPADLVNDTDTSSFLRKDKLVIALATVLCAMDLDEDELVNKWWVIYSKLFEAALAAEPKKEDWTPIMVGFGSSGRGVTGEYWKVPLYELQSRIG